MKGIHLHFGSQPENIVGEQPRNRCQRGVRGRQSQGAGQAEKTGGVLTKPHLSRQRHGDLPSGKPIPKHHDKKYGRYGIEPTLSMASQKPVLINSH